MFGDVGQASIGQLLPQLRVLVQADHRIGETGSVIGYQYVLAGMQVHAFHGAGGTDYRLAMGHAQVDLAFYAGTEPQRCDGNARAVHVGRDVFDEAVHLHAGVACGQCQQRFRRRGADAVQAYLR